MEYTDEFMEFWKAYPRRVAKGQAFKTWRHVSKDVPLDVILGALERCKADWKRDRTGKSYIPHPSTWLNQRRWEDERFDDEPEYRAPDVAPGTSGGYSGVLPDPSDLPVPF